MQAIAQKLPIHTRLLIQLSPKHAYKAIRPNWSRPESATLPSVGWFVDCITSGTRQIILCRVHFFCTRQTNGCRVPCFALEYVLFALGKHIIWLLENTHNFPFFFSSPFPSSFYFVHYLFLFSFDTLFFSTLFVFCFSFYPPPLFSFIILCIKTVITAPEPGCPCCSATLETTYHLIFGCEFAVRFWQRLGPSPNGTLVRNLLLFDVAPVFTAA